MRKTFFKIAVIGLGVVMASCNSQEKKESTAAQDSTSVESKEVITKEISPELKAMQTAFELAKYGYEVSSASALIEAANILVSTPSETLQLEAKSGNAESANEGEKTSKVEFTPAKLLASAKEMADGDATLSAMIAKVEAKLSAASEETRGAMGGPKYAYGRVYANDYTYYQQKFWAEEVAAIAVSGDGDTDLDLYVYDENGNLIASDTDYTDDCYVRWVPKWTGLFTLKIVNRGRVYNNYVIATN